MKSKPSKYVESRRIKAGRLASDAGFGNNGAFEIIDSKGTPFLVIASNELSWDHVSVSVLGQPRTPTWEEMSFIKDLFWKDTETVVQLHVPREQHINNSPYTLHLWRPQFAEIPLPPPIMVGVKSMGVLK